MSVRLLHLADLHLGYAPPRLGDRAGERAVEFADALRRAVSFALEPERRIDAVLIAGDLFDRHQPAAADVEFVRGQFRRLYASSKPVVLIPGTHDGYQHPNCIYREAEFPGACVIETPEVACNLSLTLSGERVHFYGMAYQPGHSQPPFDRFRASDAAGWHVALIHGSLLHNPAWELYSNDVPLELDELGESGMDYVALGHYHSFQEYGDGAPKVVYCGSLERKHVRDHGERWLVVAELDENGVRVEKHPFPARAVLSELLDVTAMEEVTAEALEVAVRELAPEGAILELTLEGSAEEPIDIERLSKRLAPNYLFHLDVDDQTLIWRSGRIAQWAEEPTVRGRFTRRMLEKINQAAPEDAPLLNLALKMTLTEFMRDEQTEID